MQSQSPRKFILPSVYLSSIFMESVSAEEALLNEPDGRASYFVSQTPYISFTVFPVGNNVRVPRLADRGRIFVLQIIAYTTWTFRWSYGCNIFSLSSILESAKRNVTYEFKFTNDAPLARTHICMWTFAKVSPSICHRSGGRDNAKTRVPFSA